MSEKPETSGRKRNKKSLDHILRTVYEQSDWNDADSNVKVPIKRAEFIKILVVNDITFDRKECISFWHNLQDAEIFRPTGRNDLCMANICSIRSILKIQTNNQKEA